MVHSLADGHTMRGFDAICWWYGITCCIRHVEPFHRSYTTRVLVMIPTATHCVADAHDTDDKE